MPNEQKISIVKDTTDKLKNSSGVYFTRYTGIDVQTITKLRKSFRDNDVGKDKPLVDISKELKRLWEVLKLI